MNKQRITTHSLIAAGFFFVVSVPQSITLQPRHFQDPPAEVAISAPYQVGGFAKESDCIAALNAWNEANPDSPATGCYAESHN